MLVPIRQQPFRRQDHGVLGLAARRNVSRTRIPERTFKPYSLAANQFCRWAAKDRRVPENPIAHIKKLKVIDAEEQRAYLIGKQRYLIASTENEPERYEMSEAELAILYRVALATGFRVTELSSLKRFSFVLDAISPVVRLKGAPAKNSKAADQPLPPDLIALLRRYLSLKTPEAMAFNVPPNYDTADMLREAMAAARGTWIKDAADDNERTNRQKSGFLLPVTPEGVADFHALRHTFGTNLVHAGVSLWT